MRPTCVDKVKRSRNWVDFPVIGNRLHRLLLAGGEPDWEEGTTMDFSMDTAGATLTQPLGLELIDGTGRVMPLSAELHYDPRDPYAVTTAFHTASGQVRWTFGRELLAQGLYEPAGDGDVHVWPCLDVDGHAVVIIELCSPDGEALVQARTGDLSEFVARMHAAVAPGNESAYVDLDATICAILDAA